jgi:transcriptional regulator with XRE-family HTH domain
MPVLTPVQAQMPIFLQIAINLSKLLYFPTHMKDSKKASTAPLHAFGLLVRETRMKKGLTQQRAAAGAGVSRQQWALLEKGQNVSAAFMTAVATYLNIPSIPLGGGLEATTGSGGIDVGALISLADDLVLFVNAYAERLRAFALEAALPPSERSRDAAAELQAFIAKRREAVDAKDSRRLSQAIELLAEDLGRPAAVIPAPAKVSAKRRKREA